MLIALAGCHSTRDDDVAARAAAISGAMLRNHARLLHTDVAMGVCRRPQWAALRDVRREEAAFVAAVESTLSGPAADHVAIAREDVDYAVRTGDMGCWTNVEPGFPAQHLEGVFSDVETLRAELRQPMTPPQHLRGVDRFSEPRGPAFRALVRAVLDSVRWQCPRYDMQPFFAVAKPAVARFQARMERSPLAAQFAIAKADIDLLELTTFYNCLAPSQSIPAAELRADLRTLSARIARAERIAGGGPAGS